MAPPRDPSEIEGALIPPEIPVATAVSGEAAQTTSTAVAAVPLSHFDYNTTQEANYAPAEEQYDDVPTAPFLPLYDDSEHRERKESDAVARAKQNGRLAAEVERVEIDRANRLINAIEWHTKQGVKEAKKKAKRRDIEGVQIKEDKWFGHEKEKEVEAKPDPDVSAYTTGAGYDISEYETSEYNGYQYETSEYKSVYDP